MKNTTDADSAFDENHASVPVVQFSYPEVHVSLDEIFATMEGQHSERAAEAFGKMLFWLLALDEERQRRAHAIAIRAHAAGWCIWPEKYEGKSLRSVADRLGVSKSLFSQYCIEFCVKFSFPCRALKSKELRD